MQDTTDKLKLPYIMASQAQKHITHNEALKAMDVVIHLALETEAINTPPSSPLEGACYAIGVDPEAEWAGHAGEIAAFQDGAWAFYTPRVGWLAWVVDQSALAVFDGEEWTQPRLKTIVVAAKTCR